MHAFLIVSNSPTETEKKVAELAQKLKVKPLIFSMNKIADVREVINFTKISLETPTAIVVERIDQSSTEAQNAFLKSLEEPQENLFYILTAQSAEAVLPTITSRCEVMEIINQEKVDEKTLQKTREFIELPIGQKLLAISKITKREDAIDFVTNLIKSTHVLLQKDPSQVVFIEKASQTLAALQANGNVQLQLTNFVIGTKDSGLPASLRESQQEYEKGNYITLEELKEKYQL